MSEPLDHETIYRVGWLLRVLDALGPMTLPELDRKTAGLRLMNSEELARVLKLAVERGYVVRTGERYAKR